MRLRPLLCIVALTALAAPAAISAQPLARPESVGLSSVKLGLIHDALKLYIDNGQIPGGVVTVLKDGKPVYLEAMGVAAPGKGALTPDTIFFVASLSKPVTAVAIMMLVEEGKIGLDDPVSKYIPQFGGARQVRVLKPGSPPPPFSPLPGVLPEQSEFGVAQYDLVPAERPMTVRMLLTHTSGIQIFGVPNAFPTNADGADLATRVPKLAMAPLEYQPGSRWAYSNGPGFDVLGLIVQVASGQPFNAFLKTRIFTPLDMKDTDFGVRRANMARSLTQLSGVTAAPAEEATYFSGAGGLSSTVTDYSHFAQMLTNGGEYNGRRLLKADTVKAMTSNQIGPFVMGGYPPMALPAEGVKFGYGMMVLTNAAAAGTRLPAGSFGWDGVGTRRFWSVPAQNITIVSMVPPIGPSAAPLQRAIEAAVISATGK